jgi:hypothetical protein
MVENEDMPERIPPDAIPGKPPELGFYIVGIKLKHVVIIEGRGYIGA